MDGRQNPPPTHCRPRWYFDVPRVRTPLRQVPLGSARSLLQPHMPPRFHMQLRPRPRLVVSHVLCADLLRVHQRI
jgi:hypothetical protein